MKNTPILQRRDKFKHYIGIKIKSQGKLISISPSFHSLKKNYSDILLSLEDPALGSVVFDVNPKDYPGIGLLKQGHLIKYEGEIDSIFMDRQIRLVKTKIISF
jgi:hypothetical protein